VTVFKVTVGADVHGRRSPVAVRGLGAVLCLPTLLLGVGLGACGGDDDRTTDVVSGTGYEYDLPEGWTDATESGADVVSEHGLRAEQVDSLAAEEAPASPFGGAGITVVIPRGPAVTLGRLTRTAVREVNGAIAASDPGIAAVQGYERPTPPRPTELGGERAMEFSFGAPDTGLEHRVRRLIAVHEDTPYIIGFVAPKSSLRASNEQFEDIISSWTWR